MPADIGHPIQIVARRTGLSPHVIRIWERRYNAVTPGRTGTNRRLYSDSDIERLLLLHRAVRSGRSISTVAHLSLAELRQLVGDDETKMVRSATPARKTAKENSPERFVERALAATEELDAERLDAVLRQASVALSQTVLIEQVVVPLLHRIGELWRDGNWRVAHEHTASAVMRNFLGGLSSTNSTAPNAPVFLVTTPSGHLHEFGALMASAVAASDGWQVVYLGPNLPVEEIALVARKRQAAAVGLSIVYPADDPRIGNDLLMLHKLLPEHTEVIVGGSAAPSYKDAIRKAGAKLVHNTAELRHELDTVRKALKIRRSIA